MTAADVDFVIIGAQKAGSTSLTDAISQHPGVWMPDAEIPLYRDPLFSPHALKEFKSKMSSVDGALRRGIKCPDYLGCPEVAPRLADQRLRPRLIAVLRNPISRTVSAYFWHVRWGLLPIEDPNIGIMKVLDGTYRSDDPRADEIVEWSRYGRHITHYLQWFAREDMLLLLSDDLRTEPYSALKCVFGFLELDQGFRPNLRAREANEGIYDRRRLRFARLRAKYHRRWSADRTYVDLGAAETLFSRIASLSIAGLDYYLLSRVFRKSAADLRPDTVHALRESFKADIDCLETLLGRSLDGWMS